MRKTVNADLKKKKNSSKKKLKIILFTFLFLKTRYQRLGYDVSYILAKFKLKMKFYGI